MVSAAGTYASLRSRPLLGVPSIDHSLPPTAPAVVYAYAEAVECSFDVKSFSPAEAVV